MRESKIVRDIQARVRAEYPTAWIIKLADRYTRGIPDLLILFPGYNSEACHLLVETKRKVGQTSKIQDAVHEQIRAACGNVLVARSVEEVIHAIRAVESTGRVWEGKS